MTLKIVVNSLDDVDEKYHDLYEEQDDNTFKLTKVEGMKTQADIDKLKKALKDERSISDGMKKKLQLLGDKDLNDVLSKAEEFEKIEQGADDKVERGVQAKLAAAVNPLKHRITQLEAENAEKEGKISEYVTRETRGRISDVLAKAAKAAGVRDTAIEDVVDIGMMKFEYVDDDVVTREGAGVSAGLRPDVWLSEMKNSRPHWFGETVGGGANGSKGSKSGVNPWDPKHFSIDAQSAMYRDDPEKARRFAAAFGQTI